MRDVGDQAGGRGAVLPPPSGSSRAFRPRKDYIRSTTKARPFSRIAVHCCTLPARGVDGFMCVHAQIGDAYLSTDAYVPEDALSKTRKTGRGLVHILLMTLVVLLQRRCPWTGWPLYIGDIYRYWWCCSVSQHECAGFASVGNEDQSVMASFSSQCHGKFLFDK